MRAIKILCALFMLLILCPASSLAATRALLVACSDFITQPDLGSTVSGNLHMIGSALLGVSPRLDGLSIEDGTIGTPKALSASIKDAFSEASEGDLSLLYLCTHGISSSDDAQTYLLLGDGETESLLTAKQLYGMLSAIQGDKLLILDACFSGGLIGRSVPHPAIATPGELPLSAISHTSPFLTDPSIHVLTSASSHESSWYYDSSRLSTGAVSYFASALASGMGLYGTPEADLDGDGLITLREIHRYLNVAVPSSSSQLLSSNADALAMPVVERPVLSRPLSGFTYGELLLSAEDPVLDFSFTVAKETRIQYRLIDFDQGRWNWEEAKTFLDAGDAESGTLTPGRKSRSLTLTDVSAEESGYLMLQIFALSGEELTLCSERLIAVQGTHENAQLTIECAERYAAGDTELRAHVFSPVPAEITVSVHSAEGELIRRLSQSQLTRPAPGNVFSVYWDGCDEDGYAVQSGTYTITAEAILCGKRLKAAANVRVVR